MTRAHFIVTLDTGEQRTTKTLFAALKCGCQCIGAHHIKSQRELKLLAFRFWLHHFQLTLKSGKHAATIKRI